MRKKDRFTWWRLRLVGLCLGLAGLGVNALWAQNKIVPLHPVDFAPGEICGFDMAGIEVLLCAENVTGSDTCIWTVTEGVGEFGTPVRTFGNRKGDTIPFYFQENPAKTGTITVTIGPPGQAEGRNTRTLDLKMVPPAQNVGGDITWAYPICQNLPVRFSVPKDEGYETKYEPGQLNLRWTIARRELAVEKGQHQRVAVNTDEDFSWTHTFPTDNYKDGKIFVVPFTCDGQEGQFHAEFKQAVLTPFILQGLYPKKDAKINPLREAGDAGEGEEGKPKDQWSIDESATTICRNYGDAWNSLNGQEGYVYLGFGNNFQEWLDAEDKKLLPEYYYTYEWDFDPAEFEFAQRKMAELKDQGFGEHDRRVVLRVKGGREDAVDNIHTVRLTVRCDSCIKRGGNPADFTYRDSIKLERQDSVRAFKGGDLGLDIEWSATVVDEICANTETTVTMNITQTPEDAFEQSNAEFFLFMFYFKQDDGTLQDAHWEQLGSEGQRFFFKTAPLDDLVGKTGDTVTMSITPSNSCFWNEKTQEYKVFVKNPPVKPVLYDPITGAAIASHYTETRWEKYKEGHSGTEDKQPMAQRILACNSTSWQSHGWLDSNQRFGLRIAGDRLYDDKGSGETFGYVDYGGLTENREGSTRYMERPQFEYELTGGRTKDDSTYVRLQLAAAGRPFFLEEPEVKLGFFAKNACGVGDTGIFYFKVIDTLMATPVYSNTRVEGWDTLCEGMVVDLVSSADYFTPGKVGTVTPDNPELDWLLVQTDRMDYRWHVPDGWTFDANTDSSKNPVELRAGRGSGPIGLQLGNRCGWGKSLDSNVFVHPFVRVNIVGDTVLCRGEETTYSFKKADFVDGLENYNVTYPDDWSLINSQIDQRDSTLHYTFEVGAKYDVPLTVTARKQKVPGLKPKDETEENFGCNYQFDNVESLPHHRDSLTVRVKQYTKAPLVDGDFPALSAHVDTLCADKTYTFQVKPNPVDDSVFFEWIFPDGWMFTTRDKIGDTADFGTPADTSHAPFMIRVASNRYDCAATNHGDTLDIPVLLMDTLTVQGEFMDAHNKADNGRVNRRPCEGDTVHYTVRKQRQDASNYYTVFDMRSLAGDGEEDGGWTDLEASDWKILSEFPYHDTVKMVVGRDPLWLRAANVALCDTSSFKEDTIRPISKVIEPGALRMNRPDDHLCEYEPVTFTFMQVPHATEYYFHYPWGDAPDTVRVAEAEADRESGRLNDDDEYVFTFGDSIDYQAGWVYVEAWNVCGVRPDNDGLEIVSVLTPPERPVLAQVDFADFDMAAHRLAADTVLDSLCLRVPMVLEAGPDDAAEATAKFHYAWALAQEDESVTAFGKCTADAFGWDAGAAVNASDSLWTLTKEAGGLPVNPIWLTSRRATCTRFGDTLNVLLQATDTTALLEGKTIWNYLYDKVAEEKNGKRMHIQTKPCAGEGEDVAYYLDLAELDATGESYYFRWRHDSTQAFGNVYDAGDHTLAGSGFKLKNAPADGDWTTLDVLEMTLPGEPDSLEFQVVVKNRCDEAQLPGLTVRTSQSIVAGDVYAVVPVTPYICDREELTYKVVTLTEDGTKTDTTDGVAKAGQYIWYAPWREKSDTTDVFTMTFEAAAFQPGTVYVVPNNGCGDGHRSDSMTIAEADILLSPQRVEPATMDGTFAYDADKGELLDSLCLRSDYGMAVRAELAPGAVPAPDAPQNRLSYGWFTAYGRAEALTIPDATDSTQAEVTIPDFADSAYIVYVAARRSVCQRFGDSLRIELFPMDTIRFINDPVEDSLPYDRFTVLTRGALQDLSQNPPVDTIGTAPCTGSAVRYGIRSDFHWSLSLPETNPDESQPEPVAAAKSVRRAKRAARSARTIDENRFHFSWNNGQTDADADRILEGTTAWLCDDVAGLPYTLSVGAVGRPDDILHLSVHVRNVCGRSVSRPLDIVPHALMDPAEKPVFKPLEALCEKETVRIEVEPVAAADGYIWQASFRPQPDTTDEPWVEYTDFTVEDGTVTVYGFNACGDGERSDVLALGPLSRIPDRPAPKWFDGLKMSAAGDTVYDTLCLHGNNLLWVQAVSGGASADVDEARDETVFYDWQLLPAYADLAELTSLSADRPLAEGPDSVYLSTIPGEMDLDVHNELRLMVAARRQSCTFWSDTLFIVIRLTDTVSVADLGRLFWYDPDTDDKNPIELDLPYCPGRELRIGIEHEEAAPAYRWQFPDPTWRFADGVTDTTAAVVKVIVGETGGVVRVSPLTDPDNRRCAYFAGAHALASSVVELEPALPAREFVTDGANAFAGTPCAGTAVVYALRPPAADETDRIMHYRWAFPSGWRVYDADGNLTEDNRLEEGALSCRVLPDSSSGDITAYVISQCGTSSHSVSRPVTRVVRPMDTARLALVADPTVCKDSTLQIELEALNEWTYGTGYDLGVTYLGSDAAVVTPAEPLSFVFPNAPDSSLVMVGWYSGDSVRLTFTPRHTGGCAHVQPAIYALRADTIPTIEGRILGPDRICRGGEATFTVEVTNLDEEVEVSFHWEVLADEGWEIVSGGNEPTVTVRAGEYADETAADLEKVLRCYPRALCGTAAPFEKVLSVNPPAVFNGRIRAMLTDGTELTADSRPCIGSDLMFELTHDDAPAAPVYYLWETPEGWMRQTADSLTTVRLTAAHAGADTVRVRYLQPLEPLSCGLSQAISYVVAVRDSAPKARLSEPPYPCRTRTEVAFTLLPDAEIDRAEWTVSAPYDGGQTVTTDEGSAIENNRLTLRSADGFAADFTVAVRSRNVCGSRDTVLTIHPVESIPDLAAESIHISHYCPDDSAYAYVEIPADYLGKGVTYHWTVSEDLWALQDSLVRADDDPSGAEQIAWLWFEGPVSAADTATVGFYARNDCRSTETVTVRTAPYSYTILARAVFADEADTSAVYGQSGVGLAVVATQYGQPSDYTYAWHPADRVTESSADGAAAFATQALYNRWEQFDVLATERIEADADRPFYLGHSACESRDTVRIFVDSTFAMAPEPVDTACLNAPYSVSARPYGGNSERYYFDWYRATDSGYELLADAGHEAVLELDAVDMDVIRLMVIGRDTTLIYGDTPDEPEEPAEPTEPDEPANPDDPELEAPESPSVRYVFSQVDTQYIELQAFAVDGRWVLPGRDEIQVPFGTKVRLSAEARGGSRQYVYEWSPEQQLERHDSTVSSLSTLRLYDDCEVQVQIRDLMTGCRTSLQLHIGMQDEMGDVPNAFSPNGDGINDVFMQGTDLRIYDRFGQELFRSSEAQEGWDGTFKGATVEPGDYLFVAIIRKDGKEYVKKGTVTVFTK